MLYHSHALTIQQWKTALSKNITYSHNSNGLAIRTRNQGLGMNHQNQVKNKNMPTAPVENE